MRYVLSTNGSFSPFFTSKKQESDRNLTVFFFFFYKTPSNGCLYIYNSISEAHIIGRQLLCIQKNKIVDKVHKKKNCIFFFFMKKFTNLLQLHHRTINSDHHSPSHRHITVILRSEAAYSQTLSVSYQSHLEHYRCHIGLLV